jgi:large subunit ribosomal protein L35
VERDNRFKGAAERATMPKIKTSRSAAKRFGFSKTGKVKHKRAYLRHLLSSKSGSRKRHLRHAGALNKTDSATVHKLLPYL